MIEIPISFLIYAGGALLPVVMMALFGSFIFYKIIAEEKKKPMDKSNRINHLRLVWFTLNAPHRCVELYYKENDEWKPAFPWLKRDEGDNVDGLG